MFSLSNFTCFFSLFFLINLIFSQQFYDKSNCASKSLVYGYLCSLSYLDCETFIIYRAQHNFNTISSIASLFNRTPSDLLSANHLAEDDSISLSLGQDIIIPASCHCRDGFSQAVFLYNFSSTDSVNSVACGVFEGLVKAQKLVEENSELGSYIPDGYFINVSIRCACPELNQRRNGVNYLVTYPVMEGDHTDLIASKFNVPENMIWDANKLGPYDTIFPKTTLLIPTKNVPALNRDVGSAPSSLAAPKAVIPLEKVEPGINESRKLKSHVFLVAGVCLSVITMVLACGVFIYIRRKDHQRSFQPLSARNSMPSPNVSPDFLDGMSKLKCSPANYTLEEIRIATDNFNETSMISTTMYWGKFGGSCLAIEEMDSEEAARHVIYILTKINHLNIVKLEGFCNESKPYLVFEFAENGRLWDCLSNKELDRQLTWARRLQIAFDLSAALHYLHYSTAPAFVHNNINSKNVLINIDWRAKISGFSLAKPVIQEKEGQVSLKMDVFSFGVILLELISAKEVIRDGKILIESVNFLVDEGVEGTSNFMVRLRGFIDPVMEEDYPSGEAICLALLAKSCIEEDPSLRPTMNDVLMVISRIV